MGVRDYIHVTDLAEGHVQALQWMARAEQEQCKATTRWAMCATLHKL